MERYILGLDLGVASIGFALITINKRGEKEIVEMGSRIIPLSMDDKDEFSKGNALSKNQKRTTRRAQRRGYFRYKLRRNNLRAFLEKWGMRYSEDLIHISAKKLFGLRAKAVSKQITLPELGRILYHLNQKRGYKSSRADLNLDKKDTAYIAEVKGRHQQVREGGQTIGQYLYQSLQPGKYFRVKQQVFPREAYMEEFDIILKQQQRYYPEILTEMNIDQLRNEIIYYQRGLKSQKNLVRICELEGVFKKSKTGKEIFAGPRVAPRSSPLFQVAKLWESINAINLKNKRGEIFRMTDEQRRTLFTYLDNNRNLSEAELFNLLEIARKEGWRGNKQTAKGIQGNLTKSAVKEYLKDRADLLQFDLEPVDKEGEVFLIDKETGEVKDYKAKKMIDATFEGQPFYRLWHIIYSIQDAQECRNALQRKFGLSAEIAGKLVHADFSKPGFGNKSAKAIRKILPYLQDGCKYSDACSYAGYHHSRSMTAEELPKKELLPRLPLLKKNSLRQPVVEKILNQMINIVNAIMDTYGRPGEIRIELARELKQSREERNETFFALGKRTRENKTIMERIESEYGSLGIRATRNTIIKWRLFHEMNNRENELNATCIYCGQPFGITDALLGNNVDVEHIIPRSRLFDDSQSNKTLVHRKCNEDKRDHTAFDFMQSKGEEALSEYLETIDFLYKNRVIGKTKRDKLLMSSDKIPKNYIDRQLRETQYIARKAKEILENICYNVWSTSGNVTEYLRRIWGWNDVLMNLQLPKYKELDLIQFNEGQTQQREEIQGWSKRDDHRHHAIDALVVACTEQGFIQRINTLNASKTRDDMRKQIDKARRQYDARKSLLENYIYIQKPFSAHEVGQIAANILVSFKAGKRVATMSRYKAGGKNKITGVLVPRGPLSEESIYGRIKSVEMVKPVKYLLEHPELIFKRYIKALVEERLSLHDNVKLALASLKKEPIYLDEAKTKRLEYGTCYKEAYVIKYPLSDIKAKDVPYIVDLKIREIVKARLEDFGNNEKEAFKTTLWYNEHLQIPIISVRCFTGLSAVVPVKKDHNGIATGFVKPGNNHHITIYVDEKGKKREHICSFGDAVERKKHDFPVVIENPKQIWNTILSNKDNYPEDFLLRLPLGSWQFCESLQQNEMFLLGLSKEEAELAIHTNNKKKLSHYLYRVQKITASDYTFRHHLETRLEDSEESKMLKRFFRIKSISGLDSLNPIKLRIDVLGRLFV